MAEMLEDNGTDAITVGVYRTSSTVAGGRRFSFAALVVVGNRRGEVGVGYAKSNQVPQAVEKATREARRKTKRYPIQATTEPLLRLYCESPTAERVAEVLAWARQLAEGI